MNLWPDDGPTPLQLAFESASRHKSDSILTIDPIARLHEPHGTADPWDHDGSFVGPLPGRLHAKQMEARLCGARHRFLFWANQSGKTSYAASDWVEIALGRHPVYSRWPNFTPPVTLWASSLTWDLWETVQLPELLSWLPSDRILEAPEPFKKSNRRIIRIKADNGTISAIEGKSAEQGRAKYQARRVHGVWPDEEHPESIWNEVLMRLVRYGGITLTTATPLKGFTWLYHLIYEPWKLGKLDRAQFFCSHAGMSDNPGIAPDEVERAKENVRHNRAQLEARLFGRFARPEGVALAYDPEVHPEDLTLEDCQRLVKLGQCFGGMDFGAWRFAFTLWAADAAGVVHRIDEYFSQRDDLTTRAKAIHEMLTLYECPPRLHIWGDAANPQDIMEINGAFARAHSLYRVVPVARENKIRIASVERLNDLLGRKALRFRRDVATSKVWLLGYNAASSGKPVEGSRLIWEMQNWCYPDPGERKAQEQDPDDNSADGSDMIASMRYAVMSWWRPAKIEEPKVVKQNYDTRGDELLARKERQQEIERQRLARLVERMKKEREKR